MGARGRPSLPQGPAAPGAGSRSLGAGLRLALVGAAVLALGSSALAESAPGLLRSLASSRRDGREIVELEFGQPFRVRGHAPSGAARRHEVALVPVVLGPDEGLERQAVHTLRPAPASGSLLVEASLQPEPDGGATLLLRFARPVAIGVTPGAGFRSVRIELASPEGPSAGGAGARRLAEARVALTRGELPRAAALLTKVLDHPEQADEAALQDAQELLALTRERAGQLAHAQAEYEAYLEHHPDGPAADRVRQRLAALRTAAAARGPAPLRPARPARGGGLQPEIFGSVSASYARYQDVLLDGALFDSSAATDLFLNARATPGRLLLESEAAGSYRADLMAERGDEARVSTLFVSLEDPVLALSGIVGRHRPRGAGMLSRLDGAELRGPLPADLGWRLIAGLPVESTSEAAVDPDRQVFALAVGSSRLPAGLEGELFSALQRADGLLDRAAVGAELRLAQPGRYVLAYADYDVLFEALNTALVTGSQDLFEGTRLSALLEVRRTPILTLRNALQGQAVADLAELSQRFDDSELRALASDRTARLWSGTLGVSQQLGRDLQVGVDALVSSLSGTVASGGVPGTESTGVEVGGNARATRSRLLSGSDVHTLTVGATVGGLSRSGRVSLVSRQPIGRSLRLAPRVLLVYRDQRGSIPDSLTLHPGLGLDYRWRDLRLDLLLGTEFTHRLSGPEPDDLALFGELVLRLDF